MAMNKETYSSPLSTRYASQEMQYLFSEDFKFRTWRRLWVSLARAERMLGLDISKEQIAELEAHVDHVNYEVAEARERVVRHDVMSHVYAYGLQCPKAAPIIHLGASVSYVGDNADVVILREACKVILKKAAEVIKNLASFAYNYRKMPCLGYTHLQPTKLTTVGKRATLWMYELCMDMENLEFQLSKLKLLGSKGDIGTQSSFMRGTIRCQQQRIRLTCDGYFPMTMFQHIFCCQPDGGLRINQNFWQLGLICSTERSHGDLGGYFFI